MIEEGEMVFSVKTIAVLYTVTEARIVFHFWCVRPCTLILRQSKVDVCEGEYSVFVVYFSFVLRFSCLVTCPFSFSFGCGHCLLYFAGNSVGVVRGGEWRPLGV